MNATSANGFNNFSVSLNNQPRNSVVGTRHIPISKFSRGGQRTRGINNVDGGPGNKRVTSINFYQNSGTQATKIKNALDLSMKSHATHKNAANSSLNNSQVILDESMKSATANATNIFNKSTGSTYMTASGNHGMSPNMYAGMQGSNPGGVYQQQPVVLSGPSGN